MSTDIRHDRVGGEARACLPQVGGGPRRWSRLFERPHGAGPVRSARASLPISSITAADNDTPAHRALSLRMAQQTMVLLKNQGNVLPFKGEPRDDRGDRPQCRQLRHPGGQLTTARRRSR